MLNMLYRLGIGVCGSSTELSGTVGLSYWAGSARVTQSIPTASRLWTEEHGWHNPMRYARLGACLRDMY